MTQHGVLIGTVTDVDDPAGMGQIRCKFQTLGIKSNWAPVAVPLAGKSRGAWIMPELEDEVLVAFHNGNFNQPFVVGFLWNGPDKPPESDTQLRVIKTPGGHELRFEDTKDKKKVILKTEGGHTITLEDKQKNTEEKKVAVTTDGGHTITMDDKQKKMILSSGGGLTITLDDNQKSITITGGGRSVTMQSGKLTIT